MYTLTMMKTDSARSLAAYRTRKAEKISQAYDQARAVRAIRAISVMLISAATLPAIITQVTA